MRRFLHVNDRRKPDPPGWVTVLAYLLVAAFFAALAVGGIAFDIWYTVWKVNTFGG